MPKSVINVVNITTSTLDQPATITVQDDYVAAFTGQFFLNEDTLLHSPTYEDQPNDTKRIRATTFSLINEKFGGKYSVRTAQSSDDSERSSYLDINGNTVIKVNEFLKPLGESENTAILSEGTISDCSTYIVETAGFKQFVYPDSISKGLFLDLPGRNTANWGEIYNQGLVSIAFNSAASTAPRNAQIGQTWFNTISNKLLIYSGTEWLEISQAIGGSGVAGLASSLYSQTTVAATWNITHNLHITYPHIVGVQIWADRGFGPEQITANSISFNTQDTLIIKFSDPLKGWVKIIP